MRPPPRQTIHEWAEAKRIVPRGTSPRHGPWRSDVFQRPVLEAVLDPANTEGVLYVGPSQRGGKTELLLNVCGYFIDADPASQILVTYSLDMAKKLSKHRVARMIAQTPALRGKVREARSRDSGNTILDKVYDDGDLSLVGANSAGGLSMSPKRVGLFDELDRWPASAGTEGDPLAIVLMRLEAYRNAVKFYVTSPGIRNTSRSWRLWQESDQREWMLTCPDCSLEQAPRWEHVHWEKDSEGHHRPETAAYFCTRCGSVWDELVRWRQCERGRYVATAPFEGLAGFRVSALGIAQVQLESLVRAWLKAQGNPEELKVFKTTRLVEWWDEQFTSVDETGLLARREPYPEVAGRRAIPGPVALLTAGVDVQDDRLEISVYGWGHGEESWCLEHHVLRGDPATPATWTDLDTWLRQPWPREAGGVDYIRGTCVDTGGHHTQAAYDFCGPRFRLPTPDGGRAFVFAIKGQHGRGEVWPRRPSKVTKKVPLWPVRVDAAKAQIYGRLQIAEPGLGYVHFHDGLDEAFFKGLTAQKKHTRVNRRGFPEDYWELKRSEDVVGSPTRRDEPLDCAVYAYAALCGLHANGFDLEREVEALAARPAFEPTDPTDPTESSAPKPRAPSAAPRAKGGRRWIEGRNDWLRR